jgi:hypothetical protein
MSSTLSEALNIYPELPIFSVEVISLKYLSYPRRPMATALYHIFIFLQAIAEKYGITGVDKVYDSLMTLIDKGLLTAYGSWSVTNFIQIFILYNLNQESPGFISSGIDEIMLVCLRDPITRAFMSERTINIHATLAHLIPLLKQRYFNIVPSSIPPNPIVVDRQYNYCPQCQPFQPAFSNSSCSYDASSVTHDTGSFPPSGDTVAQGRASLYPSELPVIRELWDSSYIPSRTDISALGVAAVADYPTTYSSPGLSSQMQGTIHSYPCFTIIAGRNFRYPTPLPPWRGAGGWPVN